MTTRADIDRARDTARRRLRVDDEVTIAQIAALTGISKHKASELLEELVASGEAICLDPPRPGKRSRRYARARAA